MIHDAKPLVDDVKAPADRGSALLAEPLRQSFPLESDGGTLPAHVVRLMLMLAHVETPVPGSEAAGTGSRHEKRKMLRRTTVLALGLAAALLRGRFRPFPRRSVRRALRLGKSPRIFGRSGRRTIPGI